MQILKNIKPLKIDWIRLKPLKTCLIASLSVACNGAPKFPTDRIFEVDLDSKICGEYQLVDPKKYEFRHIKDHALSRCNGVFGFQTPDIPKVLRWADKTQDYINDKCK